MKESYANPLLRVSITFLEIFPVGLLVSLIAAAVLRNSRGATGRGWGAGFVGGVRMFGARGCILALGVR